ncbi:hypothetical protein GCM10028803_18950 [Larkinella knui]|uniref:hypothetical protein n=1 Tax=Larkinella knui TaxID=2025310 RepID=UPI001E525979|nr:hypothetical protein [Larkinella knui]
MVIGGFAMYLNGLSRATEDVYVWMEATHENGMRLICTLLGMGYEEDELSHVKTLDFTQIQIFGLNNYIDVLTVVHRNFKFEECYNRSRTCFNPHGNTIRFLHLKDLRETKILARRPQDIRNVIQIDDFLKKQAEDAGR